MSFTWDRMHKWEENAERDITESVRNYIVDFYDVPSIYELTADQMNEIEKYLEQLNEYNIMRIGFNNICSEWEMEWT